jgi:uncharacterized protein YceH (UPF0502 family)
VTANETPVRAEAQPAASPGPVSRAAEGGDLATRVAALEAEVAALRAELDAMKNGT